ncbi:MAG: RNA polymerase factor sigma-54, partial [Planctomycetia bacterium]
MSQHMRQLQTMKLAPRMIQSMEILQLPVMALEERIRQEASENPALEVGTSATESTSTDLEAGDSGATRDFDPAVEYSEVDGEYRAETAPRENAAEAELAVYRQIADEWNDTFSPSSSTSRWSGMEMSDKKHDAMQNMADRPPSLEEHLLDQLQCDFADEETVVLEFARHLIGNLDARGYLNGSLESLRASFEKPIAELQGELALEIVQDLEPSGVGARDLRECLLLQLREPPPMVHHVDDLRTIVSGHLDDLKHNRWPAIERRTGIPLETIREAVEDLRHLRLHPAADFTAANVQYVVPDVSVEIDDDGEFVIEMNEDNTPNVFISRECLQMLQEKQEDPTAIDWIRKKINAARLLIEAIEQRRRTLEKVTRAILEHQRGFLEHGPEA